MHIINCASLSRLVRYGSCSVLVVLTIMTGHRSLAEIYAKLVLSEVIASAADVRLADLEGQLIRTGLGIVFHFDATVFDKNGRDDGR